MTTPDFGRTFFDFWKSQAETFAQAQTQAGAMFAEGLSKGLQAMTAGAPPAMPGLSVDMAGASAELSRVSKSVAELWSAAAAMSAALAIGLPTGKRGNQTVEATLRKIVDPSGWLRGISEMDDMLGRMAEGPRFADLWQIERLYASVMYAWATVRRCGLEHNAVVLQAWMQAGQRFLDRQNAKLRDGEPALTPKAALALWTDIANQVLLETQRSEPFLKTQAAMIRASTALRLAQQALVEHFGKQYGFPTRSELDDVHRTLTELRREVRALRRPTAISDASGSSPSPSAQPEAAPAASSGARRRCAKQETA